MRNVRCLIMNERPEGYRLIVRLDNGHVARRRKLEAEERQIKLTDVYDPFVAVAILQVDDETWEAEYCQVQIRQDEFDALRQLPDVKMADLKPTKGQIEGKTEDDVKKKGRK